MSWSTAQRERFWRELMLRFEKRLRTYLRRAKWNDCEIEELLWDTWALAVESEDKLTASSDPWPALRTLAAEASSRRLRVRRHELVSAADVLSAAEAGDREESTGDAQILARWTERVMAQLPPQQRVAVDFRYRWRWPYWAVAAAIGTTESTARVHVWRGLDKLRRIAADCPPPDSRSHWWPLRSDSDGMQPHGAYGKPGGRNSPISGRGLLDVNESTGKMLSG